MRPKFFFLNPVGVIFIQIEQHFDPVVVYDPTFKIKHIAVFGNQLISANMAANSNTFEAREKVGPHFRILIVLTMLILQFIVYK